MKSAVHQSPQAEKTGPSGSQVNSEPILAMPAKAGIQRIRYGITVLTGTKAIVPTVAGYPFGAACRIWLDTSSANFLKFSRNMLASLSACAS